MFTPSRRHFGESIVPNVAKCIASDTRRLALLHIVMSDFVKEAHDLCAARRQFLKHIANCAEDGQVALVESGRDCDGVQYSGYVTFVDATAAAVDAEIYYASSNADGPCWFEVMKPSVARTITYHSRDLALEAFENGHSHLLRP